MQSLAMRVHTRRHGPTYRSTCCEFVRDPGMLTHARVRRHRLADVHAPLMPVVRASLRAGPYTPMERGGCGRLADMEWQRRARHPWQPTTRFVNAAVCWRDACRRHTLKAPKDTAGVAGRQRLSRGKRRWDDLLQHVVHESGIELPWQQLAQHRENWKAPELKVVQRATRSHPETPVAPFEDPWRVKAHDFGVHSLSSVICSPSFRAATTDEYDNRRLASGGNT